MSDRLRYFLWNIWIPDYEGGEPWHLRWRASLMYWVRNLWFHGAKTRCICPGCPKQIKKASASGLCYDCANESDDHELADDCATCGQLPDVWETKLPHLTWAAGCGCGDVLGTTPDDAVLAWNRRQCTERAKETGR